MFKEKIIAAFKLKYPGINLSKARLNAIATRIETKVIDDETKIDAALAAMDDAYPFTEIAKDDDKIRTLEAKTKPAPKTETPAEKAAREAAEALAQPDDTPAWAKALIEQNKTLAQEMAAIKGEKVIDSMRAKATEKLKEIPATFWIKRSIPENDEALEAFVTEVTTDYSTFKQEMTNSGLSVLPTPRSGAGGHEATKAVSADVKAFAEKQAAATKVA